MNTITLTDCLSQIDEGHAFSLAFITANKSTGEGGEMIFIQRAVKHQRPVGEKGNHTKVADKPKNPRHYQNSTRNIVLPNGEIRKVHIRLIRRFNNKIVT